MKKITLVSIASFIFLAICSFVGWVFRFASLRDATAYVVIGLGVCLISGILMIILRRKSFIIYPILYLVNAFALGLCIRGWYIFRGYDNPIWMMLLISLASSLYLLVFYAFLSIPVFNQHYTAFTILFMLISIIIYVLLIVFTKTTYLSTYGWYMIIEIGFIFALSIDNQNNKELFQYVAMSTYSVIVVAILMLIIMAGGDGIDLSFDGLGSGSLSSPRKKKIRKR